MIRRAKQIRVCGQGAVVVLVLALAGCGKPSDKHARTGSTEVPSTTSAPTRSIPVPTASPAGERAALDAVAVARAFTAAVCPYNWRDPVPYGSRLNTALARWGTAEFIAAHRWSPARIATAAAGMAAHQAQQSCGAVTGGLDPEADPAGGVTAVRLSVTVTAQGQGSAAWTAQQVFDFQLVGHGNGWLISSGHW